MYTTGKTQYSLLDVVWITKSPKYMKLLLVLDFCGYFFIVLGVALLLNAETHPDLYGGVLTLIIGITVLLFTVGVIIIRKYKHGSYASKKINLHLAEDKEKLYAMQCNVRASFPENLIPYEKGNDPYIKLNVLPAEVFYKARLIKYKGNDAIIVAFPNKHTSVTMTVRFESGNKYEINTDFYLQVGTFEYSDVNKDGESYTHSAKHYRLLDIDFLRSINFDPALFD